MVELSWHLRHCILENVATATFRVYSHDVGEWCAEEGRRNVSQMSPDLTENDTGSSQLQVGSPLEKTTKIILFSS